MRKLIVCLMLFGFAASVSADALDDAVAHWGFADGTDLNGPPNSDLGGFSGTDISGEIITAPNANTWAQTGSRYADGWDASSEMHQAGAMTVFARVKYPTEIDMGEEDGVTNIIGAMDANCEGYGAPGDVDNYSLKLNLGVATFRIWGVDGGGVMDAASTSVSGSATLVAGVWYDVTGVFDPVKNQANVYVCSPVDGSLIDSGTISVDFDAIKTAAGNSGGIEFHIYYDSCYSDGTFGSADALMERAALWNRALSPMEIVELSGGAFCELLTTAGEVEVYENSGEGSMTDTFTVSLMGQPGSTDIITVTLDPNGLGDADDDVTVAPGTLVFTAADWDTPQTVTVTAIDDALDDGDYVEVDSIKLTPVSANGDPNYDCSHGHDVTIYDDEAAGILVLTDSVSVAEGGGGDSFTVELRSPPTSPVTIVVAGTSLVDASPTDSNEVPESLPCQVTVNGSDLVSLVFNSGNYNTPQTVNVAAVDDSLYETDPHSIIIGTHVYTEDATYSTKSASDVDVTISENDTRGWSFGDDVALAVSNHSFEDPCLADGGFADFDAENPVPGYEYWSMGELKVINPTAGEWAAMYNAGHQQAPDGEQVLDLGSSGGLETAEIVCEYLIEPGPVSYTYEVSVGVPEPYDAGAELTFYVSSNEPAAFGRIVDPVPTFSLSDELVAGEWVDITVCGVVEADSDFVGGVLSVGVVGNGVHVDNWRLTVGNHPCEGCYVDITEAEGDLNNDCKINLGDLAVMAAGWLECNMYPECITGW